MNNNVICFKKIKNISARNLTVSIGYNFDVAKNLYKIISLEEAKEIATKELELPFSFMRTVYFCNTDLARFDVIASQYNTGDTIVLEDITPNDLGIEGIY